MYLIFDTETTGLPKRWDAPITDTDNWPRCIQIAWQLHDDMETHRTSGLFSKTRWI
jgi:DNA polymerase-3 subunit alpha